MGKLGILKSLVKVYGAKLYEQGAVILNTAEEAKDIKSLSVNGNSLCITDTDDEQTYFNIAQATIDAGIVDGQQFSIVEFTALRDASGVRDNGDAWSVEAGKKKYVAV